MSAAGGNVALATKYLDGSIQGLNIAVASNTTLTVSAGSAIDSTNQSNMILPLAITINAAVNGLNGLDSGVFQASKTYGIYEIGSSMGAEPTGGIMSLSMTAPLLPVGKKYDVFKLIGLAFSDGSTHFLNVRQVGNSNLRQYYFDSNIAVLAAGTATSLTAIDLSAAVPVIDALPVYIEVEYTPATANDKVSFAPGGSTATLLPHINGSVAAKINSGQLKVLSKLVSSLPTILYINSAAAGSTNVWVTGFEHFV